MKFTVKPEDAANAFRVELTGHLPAEDYDLTVYRIVNGKRVQVGSSAGPTGHELADIPRPEPRAVRGRGHAVHRGVAELHGRRLRHTSSSTRSRRPVARETNR